MAYVATNYDSNSNAPAGKWTCAPTSKSGPLASVPTGDATKGTELCGQCVSYVKTVCPSLPATFAWKKGPPVKGNDKLLPGTVIATFSGLKYKGHAAIYVGQDEDGIQVYDQYVTPPSPKPVGPRTLRWKASGNSNNGNNFYVVE
ncbi:BPSL0067 family protein [Methylobacterium sp. J-068]|uniref:BPSL0067 family protein n=1 Tax=Methylobacterium sp. J-068 TaxID=2836649 RepID=UPI001FB9880E|nr:BPSL0067 family protein [Methylobacterium sp. J-068]MCJ2035696.1 BPSL0067 family protein [Methylobacterium sp. J-068]